MTLLRLALRSHRTGAIATAVIAGFAGLLNSVAYVQVAGSDPAQRAAFAAQMEILGKQLSYLLPQPAQLDTLAGYLVWRDLGTITLVVAIWGVLAGTGAGRGDEERGLVETWLASGVSRLRWSATRAVGFAVVSAASLAVGLGLTWVGTVIANEPIEVGPIALEGLVVWGVTLVTFAIGLVVSQLVVTRRGAGVVGGMLVIGLYVVNSAARSGMEIGTLAWTSPFYLYDRSTPMLRGGVFDGSATLLLLLEATLLGVLAMGAFARRDVGAALLGQRGGGGRHTVRPAADPVLRLPVLALIDQQRLWIAGWALGLAALAAFFTSLTRTIVDTLDRSDIPMMRIYFQRLGVSAYADFLGAMWFGSALFLISAFVVVQINGWSADDGEGRLEAILTAPVSRGRVVIERLAALLVAVGIIEAVTSLVVYWSAQRNEIVVAGERLALASLLVLPVAFAFGGIGHALVGWRPRVAVVALSTLAVVSYFTQQFAPLFDWPDWIRNTSLYALYGMPLKEVDWPGIGGLVAIGAAGTAGAVVAMRRRDVGG